MQKKVRWGVLGTATIARNHTLPGMLEAENCELYAIAGRDPEKTAQFQKDFGFQKAYHSYDELLDDENIDAVYIPLPNQLHKEWTIRAARKKKHVLCEKPLAPTEEEVREVVDVCRQEGVLLMEAFAYLHSNATREVIEAVRNGVVGKPVFVETTFIVKPWQKENIRMRRETFGGCTYDQGCYNLSLTLQLLDEMPDEIQAMAHYMPNGVDDLSTVYMHFHLEPVHVQFPVCVPDSGQTAILSMEQKVHWKLHCHITQKAPLPITFIKMVKPLKKK